MKSVVLAVAAMMVVLPRAGAADPAPSPEAHARAEFQKYATRIVGKPATIDAEGVCTVEGTAAVFAIGRCRPTDALAAAGKLRVPSDLGDEGFLIKSVDDGARRYVVILGGSPRGTLYGVYRYLEQFCRVGFFWDGEHVPRRPSLPTAGIDAVERPRWPMRQYMMDCEYTSYWWNWDQWQAEVDWAAKHRFNVLSSNFDFTATWRAVWKRFGVEVPPTSLSAPPFHPWAGWHKWAMRPPYPVAYQDFQADLAKRFTEYGRSVGLKMAPDFHGFIGQVPREFAEAYRGKARFLEVRWVGFDPPGVFLHPDDPLYLQVAKAFAEEYLQRFGTDHLWASQSYCEMRPSPDPKEILAIEIALAKKNLEAIRSVDPQAVLFTNSWTFLDRRPEDAMAFLQALPADAFQVWEMPSDLERGPPMYQQYDYYGGKPWLVGFLYAYGGTTMLHGDLADMVKRVQAAAADPRAEKCRGLCIEPEAIHHNPIAFDLISRLAWDPSAVELSAFLEDYAVRRYGAAAAPGMVRCFRELTASVYGSPGVVCPLYMLRVTGRAAPRGKALRRRPGAAIPAPSSGGPGDRAGGIGPGGRPRAVGTRPDRHREAIPQRPVQPACGASGRRVSVERSGGLPPRIGLAEGRSGEPGNAALQQRRFLPGSHPRRRRKRCPTPPRTWRSESATSSRSGPARSSTTPTAITTNWCGSTTARGSRRFWPTPRRISRRVGPSSTTSSWSRRISKSSNRLSRSPSS